MDDDENDADIAKRRAQVKRLLEPVRESQWGVVLDDLGSADMYDSRDEAVEALVTCGGLALLRVVAETYGLRETCGRDVGSRPTWMSPDQYDPCPCLLPIGHEAACQCSCPHVTPPGLDTTEKPDART